MAIHYVKAKRSLLVGCLTCPLCSNLLRDATTICVCLHTFCKECIYEKFEDDETSSCPICDVYLGSLPQEKLRLDNNLQDVRMKLFPLEKPKEVESEPGPAISVPLRRKERSLSSIVISTDPLPTTRASTRAKTAARKAAISQGVPTRSYAGKDVQDTDRANGMDPPNKPSMASKRKHVTGEDVSAHIAECSSQSSIQDSVKKVGMDPTWDRLNFLAETADRTKAENSSSPLFDSNRIERKELDRSSLSISKRVKKRGNGSTSTIQRKEAGKVHSPISMGERTTIDSKSTDKISRRRKPRRNGFSTNGFSDKLKNRIRPVWFALFACEDQFGGSFPQIPKCYIRIKDGNIPVSYIKYLVQKLNLRHESEVEVTCCGHSVEPSFSLHDLVDIWIKNVKKGKDGTHAVRKDSKGCDIPEYVMVLNYSGKPV